MPWIQILKAHPDYSRWIKELPTGTEAQDRGRCLFVIASTWPDRIKSSSHFLDETGKKHPLPDPLPTDTRYPDLLMHKPWHYMDRPVRGDQATNEKVEGETILLQMPICRKKIVDPHLSDRFHANYVLSNLGDRMEMSHSVEGRVPFLDHELVEAVAAMPVSVKIQGMTEKYVLREAARPVLTDTVYRRQKHPFLSPPSTLQPEQAMFELLQERLRGPNLEAVGIYDRKKIIQLLDKLPTLDPAGRTQVDPALTTILSICILQERFHL